MESAKRMIDSAAQLCGSKSDVARRLGVAPQRLNDWESGRRAMPDAQLVALAMLAGADPRAAIGAYRWEWLEKKRGGVAAGIVGAAFFLGALLSAGSGTATASQADPVSRLHAAHYAQQRGRKTTPQPGPLSARRLRQTIRAALRWVEQRAGETGARWRDAVGLQ